MTHPVWPLFDLEVRTTRLRMRYIDDELATRLAELAATGIHDPAQTPFSTPWTDSKSPDLERQTMQFYWRCRANTGRDSWMIDLAVEADGELVGVAGLNGSNFPTLRQVVTGSWLGRTYQGRGIGKEMRLASLTLAFDGLGADRALTDAWHDNEPSLGVTRSLGYTETGRHRAVRRDQPDQIVNFEMQRAHFDTIRPDDVTLHGLDAVRDLLGIEPRGAGEGR